ncbi:MAG TPA: hypothetical protein VIO62_03745 [Candidatus Dormibacteraeota bacterium]|jgi:hypothetical protein
MLDIAEVLLVLQGSLLLVTALGTVPFAVVEPGLRVATPLTLALAVLTFVVARGIRRDRRWARRVALLLEGLVALGSALLWLLPVGAMRGPVPLLINLVLPAAVLAILLTRGVRQRAIIPSP